MPSRTRIISQNKSVYVSPTGIFLAETTGYLPQQLHRVDNLSFDIDLKGSRQDIREFGQMARIGGISMGEITSKVSFGYYLGNGENEARLGLHTAGITGTSVTTQLAASQFISGILTDDAIKRERNIYVLTAKEGEDAFDSVTFNSSRTSHDVIGFGNVNLTNYTVKFAVGEIPRVDIEAEANNVVFYTGQSSGLKNPALNITGGRADSGFFRLDAPSTGDMDVLVLRPDDVLISFSNDTIAAEGTGKVGGAIFSGLSITTASIEVPLKRTAIMTLGRERPVAKPLDFPVDVTLSMNAIVKQWGKGSLEYVLTGTANNNTIDIRVDVTDDSNTNKHTFILRNAYLDSQKFKIGLDDNETVDLTFSAQIGGANSTGNGLYHSGSFTGFSTVDSINTGVGTGFIGTTASSDFNPI